MMRRVLVAALLLFLPVSGGLAQSPYELSWTTEGIIGGAGACAGIVALGLRPGPLTAEQISALRREDLPVLERGATSRYSAGAATGSDLLVYLAIGTPALLCADARVRSDALTLLSMYAETMLLTGAVTYLVKGMVPRVRPYVYNPAAALDEKTTPDARRSFYSSHAAFAFASAVFLSCAYSDYFPGSRWTPCVWAGSMTLAGVVGYLRFASGMHFPSDLLVGAAMGSLIGYAIPAVHRKSGCAIGTGVDERGISLYIAVRL